MRRSVLFVLLGLSLAANAALLLASRTAAPVNAPAAGATSDATTLAAKPPAASAGAANTAANTTAAEPGETPADALRGLTWRTPRSDEDYRALAADLRAAGVPSRLIYRALSTLYLQQHLADSPLARAPYWQRLKIEQSKEMRDFTRAQTDQLAALLGPDARPSARLNAVDRKRQYGSLSDAKIDALAQVERDYQEMQSDLYRNPGTAFTDYATTQKQTSLLNSEKLSDLAKILTPTELAEYQLHNSQASLLTAMMARDVTLTADEFAVLTHARQTLDGASPVVNGMFTPEQMQQRQSAQKAYYEQLRDAVADDRFYALLENADPSYRSIANLRTQFPSVTPAAAYEALQLQNEAQQTSTTLFRNRPSPETIQSTYANWNARLDALLGTEAAAAYRKSPTGRFFNPPVIRRGPTSPPVPAIALPTRG